MHLKRRRREINRLGASLTSWPAGRGPLDLAAAHPIYPASGADRGERCRHSRVRRRFRARLRELLSWRRDVRRFRRDPLPEGAVERLIELAAFAPSVGLSQPWRFVAGRRAGAPRRDPRRISPLQRRRARRADPGTRRAIRAAQARRARRGAVPPRGLRRPRDRAGARPRPPDDARDDPTIRRSPRCIRCGSRRAPRGSAWAGSRSSIPRRCGAILDVPAAWRLIGYFCLGYPAEEDDMPMLEARGLGGAARRADGFVVRR